MLTKPLYPSFYQFVMALQAHEQLNFNNTIEQDPRHDQAYVAQRGRDYGRNGGKFNSHRCGFNPAARYSSRTNYNTTNHREQLNENDTNSKQDKATIICQIYGKYNHSAIECWSRFDHSIQLEDC